MLIINAEIITFGRELLLGNTINTNGSWMAKQLTALGVNVTRITVAGDSVLEIFKAVSESMARKPGIIITTGGLGTTYDDLTLEGIASALSLPREINSEALTQVKKRYRALKMEMTQWREKMALMPIGSKPLPNRIGSAPGLFLEYKGTLIFSLPGVPREMMEMFNGQVAPILRERLPSMVFRERQFTIEGLPESSLAPLIEEWVAEHQGIYLKSHPGGSESRPTIIIHLSIMGSNPQKLDDALREAQYTFSKLIESAGGSIGRE